MHQNNQENEKEGKSITNIEKRRARRFSKVEINMNACPTDPAEKALCEGCQ